MVRKCTHGNMDGFPDLLIVVGFSWFSHPNVHRVNSLPFLFLSRIDE